MTISQVFSIGLGALLIGGILFVLWQGSSIADEIIRLKWRKVFSEDLALALMHRGKNLTLQHVQQIAETRGVTQHDIQRTLKILLREVLAERNISLQEHQGLIESFIKQMKEREPFDGLPNEVRIHLERLREEMLPNPEKLEPLTVQIRELVALKGREHRNQKYYTVGGFAVGILGLAFATYAYWFPPENLQLEKPTPEISAQR